LLLSLSALPQTSRSVAQPPLVHRMARRTSADLAGETEANWYLRPHAAFAREVVIARAVYPLRLRGPPCRPSPRSSRASARRWRPVRAHSLARASSKAARISPVQEARKRCEKERRITEHCVSTQTEIQVLPLPGISARAMYILPNPFPNRPGARTRSRWRPKLGRSNYTSSTRTFLPWNQWKSPPDDLHDLFPSARWERPDTLVGEIDPWYAILQRPIHGFSKNPSR